jgi:hypothetical protein
MWGIRHQEFAMHSAFIPDDDQFLDHGFVLATDHDPSELMFAYARHYSEERTLRLLFGPVTGDLQVEICFAGKCVSSVSLADVESVAFQAWHADQIVRISLPLPRI